MSIDSLSGHLFACGCCLDNVPKRGVRCPIRCSRVKWEWHFLTGKDKKMENYRQELLYLDLVRVF